MSRAADPVQVPLARLLAMAFRDLIDGLHERLAAAGWHDVHPRYGYVLVAVADEPRTVAQLGELLGSTKQAASALVAEMENIGYVRRRPHPDDARAKLVSITPRGTKLLTAVLEIYADLERDWAVVLGAKHLEQLRTDLAVVLRARHGGQLPDVRPT